MCRSHASWFKGFLVALLLDASVAAGAPALPPPATMRIGFELEAQPISAAGPDGAIIGFAPELMQAIAVEMGFTVEPVIAPWAELLARFHAGDVDVLASLAYSPERDAFLDFSVRHLQMRGSIFVRRGESTLTAPEHLAGRRIAVQRESFSHQLLRRHGWDGRVVFVPSLREALRLLDAGECDAVLGSDLVGHHFIVSEALGNVVDSGIPLPDFKFDVHSAVRAGDAARLAILNEGILRIRETDTFDRIHARWIGPLQARSLRWSDLQPYVPAGVALLAGMMGALAWQRRMVRRLAEQTQRLAASEERLRHVLDGSEDGFWDWDLASGRIERSARWAAMLGYDAAEIPPTLAAGAALVHRDDLAAYCACEARLTSGAADRFSLEFRMRTKQGEWKWILDRGKVVARDTTGRALRMAGTFTDVSQRKLTEAALIESQSLLKRSAQLLEQTQVAAHIGGWEADLRTGKVYWTAETYRLHETTPEEFLPDRESVYSFYPLESREALLAAAERAVREGTPYALELEFVTARGNRRHVHTAGAAEWDDGKVVKLYGSFRDITADKLAEQEREKLRLKMLEAQKLESLGVLAGGIAHDFNNLLTAILANASFLRHKPGQDEEKLGQIEAAARRAADLCRQMLAYAGKGSFVIAHVDLAELVRDTTELIHVSISKKARLALSISPGVPTVQADASQLHQVVMNLVINASEALADAPGEIRLALRRGRPDAARDGVIHAFDLPAGDCVCLEVSDTGQGMTPATLTKIFDPFFTTKFAGRGLGLAAVLGIVRAHRGALTVASTPGLGSTFRLFLPGAALPAPAQPDPSPVAAPFPLSVGASKGTVLVADDEPVVLETTAALLRHHGYQTLLAGDGDAAIARFSENAHDVDVVLLDLTMPRVDGAEAARAIRALRPGIPLLVMSGFSEQEVFRRLEGVGRVAVMRKPFSMETLLDHLHRMLVRPAA